MTPVCAAVIVAAGSSRRAGFDKLMAPLGESTVLGTSFRVFYDCPLISEIVVVTSEERFDVLAPENGGYRMPVRRVDGGVERYHSVMAGLRALKTGVEFVAVHDGARPLLHPDQLMRCLDAAALHGAAASARPVVDTLKRATAGGFTLSENVDRDSLWSMETPQVFERTSLEDAYRHVAEHDLHVTDDVSALETLGKSAFLVQNPWPNPKITLPGDLEVAETLWSRLYENDCSGSNR